MNNKILVTSLFLVVATFSFGFQINHADTQSEMSIEDQISKQIQRQNNVCKRKSIEDPYGVYTADLQTMTCAKVSLSNRPHCPIRYTLLNKKCVNND